MAANLSSTLRFTNTFHIVFTAGPSIKKKKKISFCVLYMAAFAPYAFGACNTLQLQCIPKVIIASPSSGSPQPGQQLSADRQYNDSFNSLFTRFG